jgi:hemin uptake protein HemP
LTDRQARFAKQKIDRSCAQSVGRRMTRSRDRALADARTSFRSVAATNKNDYHLRMSSLTRSSSGIDASRPVDGVPLDLRRAAVARVESRELLRDANELIILHGGREYRLRVTSNGKLILTA